MKYNIARNGYLKSLTSSGTGNVALSWLQLEKLIDGNTTSSGVSITASGVLFLELDLSNRVKIDGIKLYANDLTKVNNVKFYYKNYAVDSYTLLTTSSGSYYFTTIPSPSAPRFILTTVSGVDITLYEFEVFNDDYIVAYGTDGSMYSTDLPNTKIGYESDAHQVAIYNNSAEAMPADAYTCIDYTGTDADRYIEISASESGPYVKLEDGILIEDDNLSSEYFWSMGKLDDIIVDNNKLVTVYDVLNFAELPMGNSSSSLNVGFDAMDYDRVNGNVYMICMDGSTTGPVRLLEYLYESATWSYIGDIDPSVQSSDNFPVMAYCDVSGDRRVYVMTTRAGGFGYYDLDGSLNNWTVCSGASWSVSLGSNDMVSMCSDSVRYVYALVSRYNSHNTNREFKKFDTVSGTWSTLSDQYLMYDYSSGGGLYHPNVTSLTYDYDRNYIYLHNASEGFPTLGDHIQKYMIDLDLWSNAWFRVDSHTGTLNCSYSISYNNDYIYIGPDVSFNKYFYRLNLNSLDFESIYLGYSHFDIGQGSYGLPILVTDPLDDSLLGYSLFLAGINDYMGYLLTYNTTGMNFRYGTYTSPVFKLADKTQSSYFVIDGTTTSGLGSISYDPDVYNGTIRVRSSDTQPLILTEVYTVRQNPADGNKPMWAVWNTYTNDTMVYSDSFSHVTSNVRIVRRVANVAFDRRTGFVAASFDRGNRNVTPYYYGSEIAIYDSRSLSGAAVYWDIFTGGTAGDYRYYLNTNMQFDSAGGLWGYGNYNTTAYRLYHFDYTVTVLFDLYDGTDFLYDLAVEWDGQGVWYTDKTYDVVVHRDWDGTLLSSIILVQPRAICAAMDNGCWVQDASTKILYKYSYNAELIKTINMEHVINRMCADEYGGFWYIYNNYVYHVNADGENDFSVYVQGVNRVKATIDGCVAYCSLTSVKTVYYITYATKSVVKTWGPVSSVDVADVGVLSVDIDRAIDSKLIISDYMPANYDPVWGENGSLEWKEVKKDGYYLAKQTYHQVEVTLRVKAMLEKVIMAPAIRTQDIQSKSYKNIYLKADVPGDALIDAYEARLKTWWGMNE